LGYTANQIHREHFFLPRLIIRSSDIHAAGCFTLDNIPKRTRVLEYTGERITKAEGDTRYEGRPFTYLFGVGDGQVVIDGHGMAMFVNHSCDPNCETDEEGERVFIAAIRDIAAGEELTYDYCLYDGDDEAPCFCGSKSCRGSMYSPGELKKMARAAARKKKQAELAAKNNGAGRKARSGNRAK
jgi:SET domain-containing protein